MMYYEASVIINRSVDQVFERMTQLDKTHQLMDEIVDARKITDGPVGLGTLITESVKFGPAREDLTWEITAFEVDRLCTFVADTSFGRTQVSYVFEPALGATRVSVKVSAQISGVIRIFRPVIQYSHKKNRTKYLAMIKQSLETSPPRE